VRSRGRKGGDKIVSRKGSIIAVLITFCLTATLLAVVPTRSSGATYDPWSDINADGKVDILDIFSVARAFGSSGDATKPVMIAGYGTVENLTSFTLLNQTLVNVTVSTAGYRMITLSLYAQSKDAHQFEIFWGYKIAGKFAYSTIQTLTSDSSIHVVKPVWYQNVRTPTFVVTLEITFSEFWLSINNISPDQYLSGYVACSLNT
jgi:hypothetical protein